MNIRLDDAGQQIKEGDLIYIVTTRYQSKTSQIGRIIRIEPNGQIHYISKREHGDCRKNTDPTHFCRIESNPKTKPFEEAIDRFYANWIKKHKEFQ